MRPYLPIGIVFLAIGVTLYLSEGLTHGVAFLGAGITFTILGLTSSDIDEENEGRNSTES